MESAKAFLEKVKTDGDYRNLVGGIATADQRMEFVRKSGFEFTKEEIDRVKGELDEDQLDEVVGGAYSQEACAGAGLASIVDVPLPPDVDESDFQ